MRTSLLTVLLAVLAGNAMAEWTVIETTSTKTSYVDRDTIRRSGNIVKMWTLTDYVQPKSFSTTKSFSSTVGYEEFDCAELRSRTLQSVAYQGHMKEGAVIHSPSDTPWDWNYVVPGSVGELTLKDACAKK